MEKQDNNKEGFEIHKVRFLTKKRKKWKEWRYSSRIKEIIYTKMRIKELENFKVKDCNCIDY
jgi:hypothetical protein